MTAAPAARFFWPLLAGAAIAFAAPSPARAEFMPPLENVVLPVERSLSTSLAEQLAALGENDHSGRIEILDATLARLPKPTKFRGYVQFGRVLALLALKRETEAAQALEESIRLLPEATGPLLTAAMTYAYSDQPERAVDFLLRASRVGPEDVRALDDYEVMALLRRLWIKGDDRRAAALSSRLLAIGWAGTSVSSQSSLALQVIEQKLADGDPEGARALIPKIVHPAHSRKLLISNRYRDIWSAVEEWSGEKLRLLWVIYLNEARSRWTASDDPDVLGDYVSALLQAGHDDTVIREVLPVFARKLDKQRDYDLLFLAADVAKPLMRQNRWAELHELYARLEKIWPLGSEANALNLSGNHAVWMLYEGRAKEALAKLDLVIADAVTRTPEVDSHALAGMRLQRACMLAELGRLDEAAAIAPTILATGKPTTIANFYLCLDDRDRARSALIAGLANLSTRDEVLAFVQESEDRSIPTEYGRRKRARFEALRADPQLVSEVGKYGRILPWTLSAAAPPEGS